MKVLTGDGDTAEAKARLDVQNVFDGVRGGKDNGVVDKAVLVTLDGADHFRLGSGALVMVNDTDAA